MDTEFVNAYLQKQKDMINDLMTKIIMSETRASVAENKLSLISDQSAIIASLNQQISEKDEQIKKMQVIVNDYSVQKEKLKKELNDIRSSVKQITG